MTSHDELRELTAAYVLGALGAEDRRRLEAHLDDCPRCRDDVLAFSPVPALLARVSLEELDGAANPDRSAAVVAAARSDLLRLRRSRRRWRVAAAAAVVLAVVGFGLSRLGDGQEAPPRDGGVALAVSSEAGVDGTVVADERAWGTYVHVSLTDLPARDVYELWLVDRDGRWHPAGTWGPTPEARANLGSSTSLRLDEIDRLVVTSAGRGEQLATAT